MEEARRALIRRLRLAYAGELAAATAYEGHWRSVRDEATRAEIRKILAEELAHRQRVGEILQVLGARPRRLRDAWMRMVGLTIAASCFVGGRYIPMYGAGKIERKNIREYEDAARLSHAAGLPYHDEFLHMAEVEWDHEKYFHDIVRSHRLHKWSRSWRDPPPRQEIRLTFARDTRTNDGATAKDN